MRTGKRSSSGIFGVAPSQWRGLLPKRAVASAAAAAAVATIAAVMTPSPALAVVQDYNHARGSNGYLFGHGGNGFYLATGAFDGRQYQSNDNGPPGAAGEFFYAGSDGGFIVDAHALLGQGATWDQSANLSPGDNGGYLYMDYFQTGTPGYPTPVDPPPYTYFGSTWLAGSGNDIGPYPVGASPNVLIYADVLAPAGKPFEVRIESDYTTQANGFKFTGTGTGNWVTIGGQIGAGTFFGSFDPTDPNLGIIVAFASEMTWDSGGPYGSPPAILRFDNLTFTPGSSTWTATAGGNWSNNANWNALEPSGRNAVAILGPSSSPQTVTLDTPAIGPTDDYPYQNAFYVGTLRLNSAAAYTIAGNEPLIIDTTAANGTNLAGPNGSIEVQAGNHTISAPLRLNRTTDVNVAAGTSLTVSGNQTAQAGAGLIKSGTGDLAMKHVRAASLTVNAGKLTISSSGGAASGASNIGPLSINLSARLDLRDNKLITTTPAGTASGGIYTGLQREVQRAYNLGAWNSSGLTTSMPAAATGLTTIGVATGAQVRGLGPTDTDTFAGQIINGASTIAMYTYAGDANLDGTIDGGDYGVIDNFVQVPGAHGYGNGDFNYDGVIDGGDYGIIDNNIQAQGAPFPTSGSSSSSSEEVSGVVAIPEPSALGFAFVAGVARFMRRRRRH